MNTSKFWIITAYMMLGFAVGAGVASVISASGSASMEVQPYLAAPAANPIAYEHISSEKTQILGIRYRVSEIQPANAPGINCLIVKQNHKPPVMDCYEVRYGQ